MTVDKSLTIDALAESNLTLGHILGNVTFQNTVNASWTDSDIGGSIFWLNNGSGSVIGGNTVHGNIICSGNAMAPTNNGALNKVHGHETGQCAGLHQTETATGRDQCVGPNHKESNLDEHVGRD